MRLLLIEDSARLRLALRSGLERCGYAVDVSGNGEQGLFFAQTRSYDALILDLMLPGLDGLSLLRRLRRDGSSLPVLCLTDRDAVGDRVRGLCAGADDYLIKPFAFDELLARIEALVRRRYGNADPVLNLGDLVIDTSAKSASFNGKPLKLTRREFMLLEYLALRRGQAVSRFELREHLYPEQRCIMSNAVDSAVCCLRRKLAEHGCRDWIQTRRGYGYSLDVPVAS